MTGKEKNAILDGRLTQSGTPIVYLSKIERAIFYEIKQSNPHLTFRIDDDGKWVAYSPLES